MKRNFLLSGVLASLLLGPSVFAQPAPKLSDPQIAEIIVRESRQAYYRTGHPCACPEDLARNGSGKRSTYSRPCGAQHYCYVANVPAAEIARYRPAH